MVPRENKYEGLLIYNALVKDIKRLSPIIIVSGLAFFVLLLIIIPMSLILFFGLFVYNDLTFFNHGLIDMFRCTKLFLLPYTILLIVYFSVMYFRDKELHRTNEVHFKKAIKYFMFTLFIALMPYLFDDHIFITAVYFLFFILTIYHLSVTYYDVELQKAYGINHNLYRSEDLGWVSSHGLEDNPFSISDDKNRVNLFVQTSTLGFDFVVLFVRMLVRSVVFVLAIRSKRGIQESARLFDLVLEDDLDGEYEHFSTSSKIVLESVNYLTFRGGKVSLLKRGEEVAKLARKKEKK